MGAVVAANPGRTLSLRYQARLAPLRTVAAIVPDALGSMPEWSTERVEARERLVTHEGEYAYAIAAGGH